MFFGNSKPEVSYGVPVSFTISLEQTYSCVFTPYQKRSLLIITCIDKIGSMVRWRSHNFYIYDIYLTGISLDRFFLQQIGQDLSQSLYIHIICEERQR